jgi:hypothetical protein
MSEVYTASLVREHVWAIAEGGVRCILCEGENEAMLVDTGLGRATLRHSSKP